MTRIEVEGCCAGNWWYFSNIAATHGPIPVYTVGREQDLSPNSEAGKYGTDTKDAELDSIQHGQGGS